MKSFYISYLKVDCLLPSSALVVKSNLYTSLTTCFVEDIGISPPMYSKAFNPGIGTSIVTCNKASNVSDESINKFLSRINEINKNTKRFADDFYVSVSELPGEAAKYPGKQIFPEKSANHKLKQGDSVEVSQSITLEVGKGLVFWDQDTFSKDDPLFSIIPNDDLVGENCDIIYNAVNDCLFRVTWTCSVNKVE
ncbi:MAG: hypothetical protein NE327_18085 [Lentisphaeraceae bacterium]|nr:hypothetical protein [Lentisphaeraceae bacterium]